MDHQFWHDRWTKGEIGFHEGQPNALLTEYVHTLALPKGGRVFVPLCGKTRDIPWLMSQGLRVAGAELSEMAVGELFEEMSLAPDIETIGPLRLYKAQNIDIYVGDIFDLTGAMLGQVDAIFDRAALVALPPDMRKRYAKHLMAITANATQLLITFDYDQADLTPPPHAIDEAEVEMHYGAFYEINVLEARDIKEGLKGRAKALERVSLLTAQS